MPNPTEYNINLNIKYKPLELIDIQELVKNCPHDWFNQSLCAVNGSVVRLGILHGEFHWHKHDRDDEFFYVVSGRLIIEFEDRKVTLNPGQAIVVPQGAMHRPVAPEKTVVLMVENLTITPTGD